MSKVFIVGSAEDHFIADRVYLDLEAAKAYCDSCKNDKWDWLVMEAPIGECWADWEVVHRTERKPS